MSLPARRRHFLLSGKSLFFMGGFSEHTLSSTTHLTGLQLHIVTPPSCQNANCCTKNISITAAGSLMLCSRATAFNCVLASLPFQRIYLPKTPTFQIYLHAFARLPKNLLNYLLQCYDVIISIIGF